MQHDEQHESSNMITYVAGNLFTSPAQVLVNTVNTEGVMGKGIALQFRKIYPEMFDEYQTLCERGFIDIGKLWIYKSPHKWILNFPTKRFWRQKSSPEFIRAGLAKLVEEFNDLRIYSMAFPALGCGNGELDWESTVKPIMHEYLKLLPADVFIYPPLETEAVPEHRDRIKVTAWLRSEPQTLPFSEVWLDLQRLLLSKSEFTTSEKPYKASLSDRDDDRHILIVTESRRYRLEYDDLRDIWKRFRAYGFLKRSLVSAVTKKVLYYIMPIFAELPYVDRIELSESGDFTDTVSGKKPLSGLQYVAPVERVGQPYLFF